MTEQEAFTLAIVTDPLDDTPRLVYADWLDEHGDALRAEFIRVQIELSRWEPPYSPWCETCGWVYDQCSCAAGKSKWPPSVHRKKWLEAREHEIFGADPVRIESYRQITSVAPSKQVGRTTVPYLGVNVDGLEFVYARGFVAELRIDSRPLLGGECGTCHGAGRVPIPRPIRGKPDISRVCGTCNGDKRTPGIARDLFLAHPVTRVVLTDIDLIQVEDGWILSDPLDDKALNREFTSRFRATYEQPHQSFPTQDEAIDMVSDSVVALCRKRAGLPPLTRPEKEVPGG